MYHLAQLNVAKLTAPLDDPCMADFVDALGPTNDLADGWQGFVWRLQTDEGDATSIRAFDDPLLLVNMSVWESVEALGDYISRSGHLDVMRRRREWVSYMPEAHLCLWWIPAGSIPTVDEAKERLEHLRAHGPTPHSFTFKKRFAAAADAVEEDDRWLCPA